MAYQLNLHPYGYIIENTGSITYVNFHPVSRYRRLINLFGFLGSLSLVGPHLQPITAPLNAEKNPFRDQGHHSWRAKLFRFAHDRGEVINVGKTRSRRRNELPPRWSAHHFERGHCSGS